MDNYNIELNVADLPGAVVTEVTLKGVTKKCVCIPIDNYIGYCADGYMNGRGEFMSFKSAKLRLSAYSMKEPKYDDTHYIVPNIGKEAFQEMDDDTRKWYERIVGYLRPWKSNDSGAGSGQQNGGQRRKPWDTWTR